jgi:hypothetical protein
MRWSEECAARARINMEKEQYKRNAPISAEREFLSTGKSGAQKFHRKCFPFPANASRSLARSGE